HVREALGGLGVVLVAVGMQLLGEFAVGGLDVLLGRRAGYAKGRIGIGHGVLARQNSATAQARGFPPSRRADSGSDMEAERDAIPHDDPLALFEAWFAEAVLSEPNDANAMALATATADGVPSVRMVLLKEHGP